jgi:hypothetical protein
MAILVRTSRIKWHEYKLRNSLELLAYSTSCKAVAQFERSVKGQKPTLLVVDLGISPRQRLESHALLSPEG